MEKTKADKIYKLENKLEEVWNESVKRYKDISILQAKLSIAEKGYVGIIQEIGDPKDYPAVVVNTLAIAEQTLQEIRK